MVSQYCDWNPDFEPWGSDVPNVSVYRLICYCVCNPTRLMIQLASALVSYVLAFLRSLHDLGLEILALHQQLASSTRIVNAALRPAGSHLECRNSRPASSRFTVGKFRRTVSSVPRSRM